MGVLDIATLSKAIHASAPDANSAKWAPPMAAAFAKWGLTTNNRVAAALGQFAVEAGDGYEEVVESMNYSAQGLLATFPSRFPDLTTANDYARQPEKIANFVYADKNGNGDEDSGDGWRFIGRGLINISGRSEYQSLANALSLSLDDLLTWIVTPEGAVQSGCWYLSVNNCLTLADRWLIDGITLRVNGRAMMAANLRRTKSQEARNALC